MVQEEAYIAGSERFVTSSFQVIPKGEQEPHSVRIQVYPEGTAILQDHELYESLLDTYLTIFAHTWKEGWCYVDTSTGPIRIDNESVTGFINWINQKKLYDVKGFPTALLNDGDDAQSSVVSLDNILNTLSNAPLGDEDAYPARELYIDYIRGTGSVAAISLGLKDVVESYSHYINEDIDYRTISMVDLEKDSRFAAFIRKRGIYRYYPESTLRERFNRYLSRGPLVILVEETDNKCVGFALGEVATLDEVWEVDVAPHIPTNSRAMLKAELIERAERIFAPTEIDDLRIFNLAEMGLLKRYSVGITPVKQLTIELFKQLRNSGVDGIVGWTDMAKAGREPSIASFLLSLKLPIVGDPDGMIVAISPVAKLLSAVDVSDNRFKANSILNLLLTSFFDPKYRDPARRVLRSLTTGRAK